MGKIDKYHAKLVSRLHGHAKAADNMSFRRISLDIGKNENYMAGVHAGRKIPHGALELVIKALCLGDDEAEELRDMNTWAHANRDGREIGRRLKGVGSQAGSGGTVPPGAFPSMYVPVLIGVTGRDPAALSKKEYDVKIAEKSMAIPGGFVKDEPRSFVVEVEGDEMRPKFQPGDFVTVGPNAKLRRGRSVVAQIGGAFYFGNWSQRGDRVTLRPINPHYPKQEYARSSIEWVYPIIWSHVRCP